jgi:hypothetical protein
VRPTSIGDAERSVVYAAVPADVAAVDVRFAGGARASAPTAPGPAYRGRSAGRVRFMLVESPTPSSVQPYLVRMLGADGRLLAAVQPLEATLPILRAPATFATGRAGGAPWRAVAFVRRELRATPLEPERTERVACVGLAPPQLGGLRAETCADEGPLRVAVAPGFDSACRPAGIVVTGVVAPRVARVVAVLGDGRRRAVAVRRLPASLRAAQRAFVLALDRDTALRSLVALDGAGRRVTSIGFGLAPARLKCNPLPGAFTVGVFAFPGVEGSELAPPPGPPRLLVADDGARLCFSIGRFGPDGADCDLPPVALFDTRVLRQTNAGRTLLAGVVPAPVQAVRVRLAGGGATVVPATPTVPGYTGRYAGAVHFFALETAGPLRARRVDLLGAGGRQLLSLPGPDQPPSPPPATVARIRGVRVAVSAAARTIPCVTVAALPCALAIGHGLQVTALCTPRRLVVTSLLDPTVTALDVQVAGGAAVPARVVRLPARVGVRGRLAVAVLPARARPVAALLRRGAGRPPQRRLLPLPAAASQCGYAGDADSGLP